MHFFLFITQLLHTYLDLARSKCEISLHARNWDFSFIISESESALLVKFVNAKWRHFFSNLATYLKQKANKKVNKEAMYNSSHAYTEI